MHALKERALPQALETYTAQTRPAPAGKRCTRCLCCIAVIQFENEYLCEACDDGTHAPLPERQAASVYRPLSEAARAEVLKNAEALIPGDEVHGGDLPITRKQTIPTPAPKLGEPMVVIKRKQGNARISEEIRQAIRAAAPSIPHSDLAHKYGISDVSVSIIRKAAGIVLDKSKRGPYKKAAEPEKPAKVSQALALQPVPMQHAIPVAGVLNASQPATDITIVHLSDFQLDGWWRELDVEIKADVFLAYSLGSHGRPSA